MSESMFVAVSADRTVRKFGYDDGVGHAFMVAPGFQRDPLAWLSGDATAVTSCGRTADGARLVEKFSGDKMCARCCRVVTDDMISAAYADMTDEPGQGESVADMIMSDPNAVLITLDTALAESADNSADTEAKINAVVAEIFAPELGTDGKPWEPGDDPARRVPEEPVAANPADLPPGPERDRAIAKIWTASAPAPRSSVPKGAKDAGQKIARQSAWKPVKEVPEAVACEPGAPFVDNGDGTGTCRSCGWKGPTVEAAVEPSVKGERQWCTGGKLGTDGCTACGRDVKVTRAGNMARHKTPAIVQEAPPVLAMASHWKHGKAPKTVVTDLQSELKRKPKRAPLAEAPATVDSGNKGADDWHSGAQAGMYRGRTSLTRGADMTGATPKERPEGGKPVPTTNDGKLGHHRTDVSARTDRKIKSTGAATATDGGVTEVGSGVKVESTMVGGAHGFLTSDEYEARRASMSREEFGAFKKWYWRRVKRVREQAERVRNRKAMSREQAKRRAREADKRAGKRVADALVNGKSKRK